MDDDARVASVKELTHGLLARHGLTTIFGNPGSNELPFLAGLPPEFRYVLGLHEGVVVGMADGYAQASGRPAFVNLHAASGTGNAMGALTNAVSARTPLVVTAGQQVRSVVGTEGMLANVDAALLPRPLVGFSAEPACAGDVPRTMAQAIFEAQHGRRGPVYVSVPYDDWSAPAPPGAQHVLARDVETGGHPSPAQVDRFADALRGAARPALVLGGDLDGRVPPGRLVSLADRLDATVWAAPSLFRLPYPNRHRRFAGVLPAGIASVSARLAGHDLVLVLGAPVFRYHQHEPGEYLAAGTCLVQVTHDAGAATRPPVGEALIADPAAVVDALVDALAAGPDADLSDDAAFVPCAPVRAAAPGQPLAPAEVVATLRRSLPHDTAYVVESTSTNADFWAQSDLRAPGSYYFPASGGLGFGMPAAVGVALAHRDAGLDRPVVGLIGDGSLHYGVTALWSAARLDVPVTFVVLRNGGYGALAWFAELLGVPDAPGIDLPGIDAVDIARGYGVPGRAVATAAELADLLAEPARGPRLVEVPTAASRPQ
ncbi:benzoylformate decarboxylase [Agilicoccus flavus]|uniref:benzoylformate decarboxylase n=1 Tax=Agilicoccus flavus TaxID=2775968 RepID=UPI001CF6AF2A|nr:benzoylformate decarboxylase [Agilicoccus flavus]